MCANGQPTCRTHMPIYWDDAVTAAGCCHSQFHIILDGEDNNDYYVQSSYRTDSACEFAGAVQAMALTICMMMLVTSDMYDDDDVDDDE